MFFDSEDFLTNTREKESKTIKLIWEESHQMLIVIYARFNYHVWFVYRNLYTLSFCLVESIALKSSHWNHRNECKSLKMTHFSRMLNLFAHTYWHIDCKLRRFNSHNHVAGEFNSLIFIFRCQLEENRLASAKGSDDWNVYLHGKIPSCFSGNFNQDLELYGLDHSSIFCCCCFFSFLAN